MKTKIFLERHGQSEGNAKRIYLGHTDLGLTEEGRRQAEITAEHLKNEKIDAVYSSDLIRAFKTAEPHAELRGLEVERCGELREMFVGDWEGLDADYLIKNCREDFTVRRCQRDFVYPNGESVPHAARRMTEQILKIAEKNEGKTVLIVSHSAAIRAFWYYLCGYSELDMTERVPFMKNGAYCILEYENGTLLPIEYGIDSHLPKSKVKPI